MLFVLLNGRLNGRLNGHLKSIQKHTIPDPGKLSTSVTNPAHRRAQKKTAKKAVPYKLKAYNKSLGCWDEKCIWIAWLKKHYIVYGHIYYFILFYDIPLI